MKQHVIERLAAKIGLQEVHDHEVESEHVAGMMNLGNLTSCLTPCSSLGDEDQQWIERNY